MRRIVLFLGFTFLLYSCATVPESPERFEITPPVSESTPERAEPEEPTLEKPPEEVPESSVPEKSEDETAAPSTTQEVPEEPALVVSDSIAAAERRWVPLQQPPARNVPTALQRRRIGYFVESIVPDSEDLYRRPDLNGIGRIGFSIFGGMGYSWQVTIIGKSQPSLQHFYGKTELSVELYDVMRRQILWSGTWNGNWTLSTVSYFDAVENSLFRLVDDHGAEIRARMIRGAESAFRNGFYFTVILDPTISDEERRLCIDQLRSIAFTVDVVDYNGVAVSYLDPERFRERAEELFSESPFTIRVDGMNRELRIVDNQR